MAKSDIDNDNQKSSSQAALAHIAPGEIIIGTLVGIDAQGKALVNYSGSNAMDINALSTVSISHQQIGRQVALLFANGEPDKPVIMGLIHSPLHEMLESFEFSVAAPISEDSEADLFEHQAEAAEDKKTTCSTAAEANSQQQTLENVQTDLQVDDINIDGKRVVLEGKEEIVLKCGEASITLTKAGKIIIRGKYLLNRSSGVNRILGSSVQVN